MEVITLYHTALLTATRSLLQYRACGRLQWPPPRSGNAQAAATCKLAADRFQCWIFPFFFIFIFISNFLPPLFVFLALCSLAACGFGAPCQTDGSGPWPSQKGYCAKSIHILLSVSAPPSCGIIVMAGFTFMSLYTLSTLSGKEYIKGS